MEQVKVPELSSTEMLCWAPGKVPWEGASPSCVTHGVVTHDSLSFFSSSSKMKRAGTTGSSRGMALYEEEVRVLRW